MNAEDQAALRRVLASFDEPGLVALASKGLLRRAQKDLETGGLAHEETETALLVRGPGWTVTMPPAGPTHATDDTRASGVTRQILTATLYLQKHWATEEAAGPAEESADALQQELLEIDVEDLQKWAGKTLVREAVALVKAGVAVEVESHAGVTIRLVEHDIEARLLPGCWGKSVGKLLDEMLTTAPQAQHKRWVVVAVLALQRSRGREVQLSDDSAPVEAVGTPLTRQQVLVAAQDLFTAMTATGLAHPSARMVERLHTLSITATAAHLPRLARLLRALSDDVDLVLQRSAAAESVRLFERLCLANALVRALIAAGDRPAAGLVGRHRTQYDPAGDLELAGVGAYPWQTASGYTGLTVLFWDAARRRFLTWTASRPSGGPGRFNLEMTYRQEAIWAGGSPERLSRSRFTLRQARVNAQGRLSGGQGPSLSALAATEADAVDFTERCFERWDLFRAYTRSTYPFGLAEHNPLDRIVVLQPASWGARVFDELQQEFCWTITDAAGLPLTLRLPWAGINEPAIEFLEALKPARDRLRRIVVRFSFAARGLLIEPLSLLCAGTDHPVLNPAFDRALIVSRQSTLLDKLRQKYGRDRIPTTMLDDEEGGEENIGALDRLSPGLRGRLVELEAMLLQAAESGLRTLAEPMQQRLRRLAPALDQAGFAELGHAVTHMERAESCAGAALWCVYLSHLHRQAIGAQMEMA